MESTYDDKSCVHSTHITNCELCYECTTSEKSYNCSFCFWCVNSSDCEFCYCVPGCSNCFMCTYMRGKEYHILNKPYSPEDYHKKVAKIKEELRQEELLNENLLYLALYE